MLSRKELLDIPADWHRTELRVPLFEVDLGQAVYHGNYFHLFELARERFLRDLGFAYKRFMDEELHLSVVEVFCAYRRSLRYDDLIEVHTHIPWFRTRSLAFSQIITLSDTGNSKRMCARATFHMVCVRFSGRPSLLPQEFIELLRGYLGREGE